MSMIELPGALRNRRRSGKWKKFFDRLRRWLIKKLGGYTEQFTPVRKEIMKLPDARAKKVQILIRQDPWMVCEKPGIEERLKGLAIESVARFLDDNGYIKWERTNDIEKCEIILRATLWAVNPEEVGSNFQRWVEVHGC